MYASRQDINVGGVVFSSSRQTLYKSSVLQSLIEESYDEVPFLDRDPTVFQTILTFLRYDTISPITDPDFLTFLAADAVFYNLSDLSRLCMHMM